MRQFYNIYHPEVMAYQRESGNYSIKEEGKEPYEVLSKEIVENSPSWTEVTTRVSTTPAPNFSQPATETSFKDRLDAFWRDYRAFLLEKDSKYGSLYLNPLNKLISLTPKERVLSRLEEKLGRMLNGNLDDNTLDDVLGLLIHLKVIERDA